MTTTIKMIEGILKSIALKTGLEFSLVGKYVYVTNFGGYRSYAYGKTKSILWDRLKTVLDHLYTMELLNDNQ